MWHRGVISERVGWDGLDDLRVGWCVDQYHPKVLIMFALMVIFPMTIDHPHNHKNSIVLIMLLHCHSLAADQDEYTRDEIWEQMIRQVFSSFLLKDQMFSPNENIQYPPDIVQNYPFLSSVFNHPCPH